VVWSVIAGTAMAALGAVAGSGVPALVARIPEPEPEPSPDLEQDAVVPPDPPDAEPKELYADIAATPGLGWRSACFAGLIGALVGARLGWTPALLLAAYLIPVGVALAVVDWRTRLLPTKVIAPSYLVLVVLAVVAAAMGGDWHDLARAGWGWLAAGGLFFVMWLVYPAGMGYGDVRLSGLLGIALGYVGWGELLVGLFAAFLLGGLGGGLLSLLRIVDRRSYPFGPFMLLGAVVGVLAGPAVAELYVR
jgi:leader peptidase (prepilin peptidase) / N-methyltransferase